MDRAVNKAPTRAAVAGNVESSTRLIESGQQGHKQDSTTMPLLQIGCSILQAAASCSNLR
jgi:hypothetical protein